MGKKQTDRVCSRRETKLFSVWEAQIVDTSGLYRILLFLANYPFRYETCYTECLHSATAWACSIEIRELASCR